MDCVFCGIVAGTIPSHKIYEDDACLAFLDIMPLSRGHTLVIPRVHVDRLEGLDPDVLTRTALATQQVARLLRDKLKPDGLNVWQNNGKAAGQDVFHYHVHLIPRWQGDGGISIARRGPTDHAALASLAAQVRG